ncbi:DUF6265 family protein [Aquiflexum gelatinilyticum]|uniref:DUF6265 family protein n=1 Tax=Aquiflexum gelatinilyticum TaxID=2961943 RepID=A0A9X2P4L9_9BACT|nr:DUF6265 family protein [Aquiflexum gelatinilyticum]MCR9013485.1 DUF6265 family protein [Aquiflexum gelatinilyticum]
MTNKSFLLFLMAFLIFGKTSAQEVLYLDKDQAAGNGSIQQLDWIVGYWSGTGLGGECDELWLPAQDNSMVGTFRFMMNGSLIFSEYMNMVEEDGRLFLKLKHFNRDLSAWEEKEEWTIFKFIKTESQTAYFSGITFHRDGDELILKLALTNDGVKSIEEFRYKKTGL